MSLNLKDSYNTARGVSGIAPAGQTNMGLSNVAQQPSPAVQGQSANVGERAAYTSDSLTGVSGVKPNGDGVAYLTASVATARSELFGALTDKPAPEEPIQQLPKIAAAPGPSMMPSGG